MKRTAYQSLLYWKERADRKPLVVDGARQVGKTWLLQTFGRSEYEKLAYFELDRNIEARHVFEAGGTCDELLRKLSALAEVDITPGNTLIVLDEVQDCPAALSALKFFCEEAPAFHIAVAGSLLGLSIHGQTSFPVGKIDVLRLFPMTFLEFLQAVGRTKLAKALEQCDWEIANTLSGTYTDLLRQYYYVGGMPNVVKTYVETNNLQTVRELQHRILADYEMDFSKHAPAGEVPRIRMVWQSIPAQLAKENKKFTYGALQKSARAAAFEMAIQWLMDAGLVYKICRTNAVKMPLKFYEDSQVFKLFMLDVGLLGAMVDAPAAAVLIGNNIFSEYKGAFTENYVCTQWQGTGLPLYYYSEQGSRIELDFVTQIGTEVIPVEVKAEENTKAKALKTFLQKYPHLRALRLMMKPHEVQERMETIPLYAAREALQAKGASTTQGAVQ